MTKQRTKPPTARLAADPQTIRQALDELGIDRPYFTCRLVGNRLEFTLYGGDLVYWPPRASRSRATAKED